MAKAFTNWRAACCLTARAVLLCLASRILYAQELQPRAYLPAPVGLGFLGVIYSGNSGGVLFDPSVPIEDSHVNAKIANISLGETVNVFGRTGQVLAVLPYAVANLSGKFQGVATTRYRSGLGDSTFRFAANLYGAPAMNPAKFARYHPKTLVGVSLTVTAPTGQYDPNVLVNIGTNRWSFRPELGISHFVRKWEFDAAFGAWLYTKNSNYFGRTYITQDPLGSVQAHVVRVLPRATWLAFDGTFYTGGRTYIGKAIKADYQGNTRLGVTFGIPIGRRQALRIAYFDGTTTRFGTDISSLSIVYNILWQGSR